MPAANGTPSQVDISQLHRADGSASYSHGGFTVVAAVNGPIEVQRRDELPEEAAVDVIVRPASGLATTRERHLESILYAALRHVILVQNHPRTLIQIILQITGTPERKGRSVATPDLAILPSLLLSSMLALMSASIGLSTTLMAVYVVLASDGNCIVDPTALQDAEASSRHAFAFTSLGSVVLAESEGNFDLGQWEAALSQARASCLHAPGSTLQVDGQSSVEESLRGFMQAKVAKDGEWKGKSNPAETPAPQHLS
ncbi:MAG: hypothetical protein M1825_002220 [Sarcosagium campestre]|nr:MAG: hypothetical protein M1825_002220 [Sarcosagium campestre]